MIPANAVDRLIHGEPPLHVWREFRNQMQAASRQGRFMRATKGAAHPCRWHLPVKCIPMRNPYSKC